MPRVVSLFLPRWPIDRLRRTMGDASPRRDLPLVLIGRVGRQRLVTALDGNAEGLGLRIGMPVAKAQALAPGLVVMDADPAADAAGLDRLALWALQRISPIVAPDPPDGLVIDTTGSDHLHGGESAMLSAIVQRFLASGVEVRAAIADSWGVAHAAARFATRSVLVVPAGATEALLRRLPIAALRLDQETVRSLRVLGVERVGELMDMPRAPLALRFMPGRQALCVGRRSLAPGHYSLRGARPARGSRCLPALDRSRPPRSALGDQGAARRAASSVRGRRGTGGASARRAG